MIIQTNTFICEVCERMESVTKEVGIYDDPVISFPENTKWGYRYIINGGDDKLRCPECFERINETN